MSDIRVSSLNANVEFLASRVRVASLQTDVEISIPKARICSLGVQVEVIIELPRSAIKIGTEEVGELKNWTLDLGQDFIDISVHGDDWKRFLLLSKNWKASADMHWDMNDDGQQLLYDAFKNETLLEVSLCVGNETDNYYCGQAYLSSLNVSPPVDDIVSMSIELTGTGPLQYF